MSLRDAARHSSLSIRRLLSLGADKRLRIFAPVLNAGLYEWPTGQAGIAFPEMLKPLRRSFDTADRVVLGETSIREIEALGSSEVYAFVAIQEARQTLQQAEFGPSLQTKRIEARTAPGLGKVGYVVQELVREGEYVPVDPELTDLALGSPWAPVARRVLKGHRTTHRHLFVSSREVTSLMEACLPDVHGNTLHHAEKREQVLAAALHLMFEDPRRCSDAAKLAREIERRAAKFWPVTINPPMSPRTIEDLLQTALRTGRVRGRR